MRVRIVRLPKFDGWAVEKKNWWQLRWVFVESFYGDNAEIQAHEYAVRIKYPYVVEIE